MKIPPFLFVFLENFFILDNKLPPQRRGSLVPQYVFQNEKNLEITTFLLTFVLTNKNKNDMEKIITILALAILVMAMLA
jgi:hypothetical protein